MKSRHFLCYLFCGEKERVPYCSKVEPNADNLSHASADSGVDDRKAYLDERLNVVRMDTEALSNLHYLSTLLKIEFWVGWYFVAVISSVVWLDLLKVAAEWLNFPSVEPGITLQLGDITFDTHQSEGA